VVALATVVFLKTTHTHNDSYTLFTTLIPYYSPTLYLFGLNITIQNDTAKDFTEVLNGRLKQAPELANNINLRVEKRHRLPGLAHF
jgi:hypothetical protein